MKLTVRTGSYTDVRQSPINIEEIIYNALLEQRAYKACFNILVRETP